MASRRLRRAPNDDRHFGSAASCRAAAGVEKGGARGTADDGGQVRLNHKLRQDALGTPYASSTPLLGGPPEVPAEFPPAWIRGVRGGRVLARASAKPCFLRAHSGVSHAVAFTCSQRRMM